MGILLRPLYAKVAFMRPDLEETAKIGFAVQEAMREVCRRTFLARTGMDVTVVAAASSAAITQDAAKSVLLVHRADWVDGSGNVTPLTPASFTFMQGRPASPGVPKWYAQQGMMIQFWPATASGGTLRLNLSYVPVTDVEEAALPELTVTAIEAKAESMLLRVPNPPGGPNYQNLQFATERDQDFGRCIGNLKAISFYGEVGDLIASPEPFPGAS